MESLKLTMATFSTIVTAIALAQTDHPHEPADPPREAVAIIVPMQNSGVHGTLVLKQAGDDVHISGQVTGLEPGKHGFHIHEFGDLRDPEGLAAGDHFNPEGHRHGGPDDKERHAGDLGNITADSRGIAKVDKRAKGLKLHFVIGRSLVVHAGEDDLKSQPSGDAGARVGIGIIGIARGDASATGRAAQSPAR